MTTHSCPQADDTSSLALSPHSREFRAMWDQPYLETCCRAALHRLMLAGPIGRPPALKDGPCLQRLTEDGFAQQRSDGRYEHTEAGTRRHTLEIQPLTASR